MATFSLAFEQVQQHNMAAIELLKLCAYLVPDAIPLEVVTQGAVHVGTLVESVAADALLRDQALEILQAYSLVRRDGESRILSVHRLMQAVLQDELEEVERRNWAERAMLAVNSAFPKVEHGTWPCCERLLSHALLAAQFIEEFQIMSEEAGRLLNQTATYLRERARYPEAEPLYQRALRIYEQHFGETHPNVAYSLHGLANLYYQQGKYTEAEPLYQRALHIWEQQLGLEHLDVVNSLHGLANLYRQRSKYAEAEPLY